MCSSDNFYNFRFLTLAENDVMQMVTLIIADHNRLRMMEKDALVVGENQNVIYRVSASKDWERDSALKIKLH